MVEVIDKFGEIKEIPFRTQYDLKGYSDNEVYEPDTSETEPGQAVNIESVYRRCMRGEIVPTRDGCYALKGGESLEEAFETMDPTQSEGFDFTDAQALAEGLVAKQDLSTAKQAERAAQSKASEQGEPAVEKSEKTTPEG